MSITGVPGSTPLPPDPPQPARDAGEVDAPELETVREAQGSWVRSFMIDAYARRESSSTLFSAIGLGTSRPMPTGPRLTREQIEALPSFAVRGVDNARVHVSLQRIEDGDHTIPGVRLAWQPPGTRASDALGFAWTPALEGVRFGERRDEEPLGLRHITQAREAWTGIDRHLAAAAAPHAPLEPEVDRDEVIAAREIAGGIDSALQKLEAIVRRAPEAGFVVDTHGKLDGGELTRRADMHEAIEQIGAALESVERREALSADERALVRQELLDLGDIIWKRLHP